MHKHAPIRCLIIGLTFLFSNLLFSQNIDVTYINPDFIEVCDKGKFEVILMNKGSDNLTNVTVEVWMPAGLSYIPGSVNDATELDISDLNRPTFSVPDFMEDWDFDLEADASCSLVADINNGKLFANTITAEYDQGMDRIITLPFKIETGLLIITEITPANASGTFSDVLQRRITIKNTRLGKIKEINFEDLHDGGIEIVTDGLNPVSTPTSYTAVFDGSHFQDIGNRDEFFDFNEEIVVTEEITITDCLASTDKTLSFITASWGCNSTFCQSRMINGTINFEEYLPEAVLVFEIESNETGNFCEKETYTEKVTVSNIGNDLAQELRIEIQPNGTAKDTSSITVTSGGVDIPFRIVESVPPMVPNCPLNMVEGFEIELGDLPQNEEIEINWVNYFCDIECDVSIPPLQFVHAFRKVCPALEVVDVEFNAYDFTSILKDSISFDIGRPILNGQRHEFRYDLRSEILDDSSGMIEVQFILPCGYSWTSNPLILEGKAPLSVDIDDSNIEAVVVTLLYQLPFASEHIWGNFFLDFACLPDCNIDKEFEAIALLSTCPEFFLECWFDDFGSSIVDIDGEFPAGEADAKDFDLTTRYISSDPNLNCNISDCEEFTLIDVCGGDTVNVQSHPFEAYLDFDADFGRTNIGLKDSNDDRVPDNNSPAPVNEIRTDRFLTGDTMLTKAAGLVVNDIFPVESENIKFRVCFEEHTLDFGLNGADTSIIDQDIENPLFTRQEGFKDIDASIRIVDQDTGMEYVCPLDNISTVEDLVQELRVLNTRPPRIFDKWRLLSYTYQLNLPNAFQVPGSTIPPDFKLTEGDSVYFEARHKIAHNIGLTMLNYRHFTETAIYNGFASIEEGFSCGRPFQPFQMIGYETLRGITGLAALPCEEFGTGIGSFFNLYLGRDNFFTFEVRPLVQIETWEMELPDGYNFVFPLGLNMGMNNFPASVSNQLITPDRNGNTYSFDILQYQNPVFDEGFYMNLSHQFMPEPIACSFTDRSTLNLFTNTTYFHDFCRFERKEKDTLSVRAFNPFIPNLDLTAVNPNYLTSDETAFWELTLTNGRADAENLWLAVDSESNKIFDFVLRNKDTNQEIVPQNGIYQLGSLDRDELNNYELTANIDFCGADSLNIYYGWNCGPYTSLDEFVCNRDTYEVTVLAPETQLPQFELIITPPSRAVELCDTIPYHTIEVFNADLGIAYDSDLSILMPEGILIIPGSSQISYSTASNNFVDIPDPTDLGNGNYIWKINDIQSFISANGLPGVNNAPQNSFSIRFLSFAGCGAIASAAPIASISGVNFCDEPTNTLTKPGDRIEIQGLTADYGTIITLDKNAEVNCGDELELSVNIELTGTTTAGDSVIITLPEGASYVNNSYQAVANAPNAQPAISQRGNFTTLTWPISPGISAGSDIQFTFRSIGYSDEACQDKIIQIQTIQNKEAFCKTANQNCDVFIQTGNSLINVDVKFPEWNLTTFNGATGTNGIDYEISGNNSGNSSMSSFTIDFYLDVDGNGLVSAGDTNIGSQTVNSTDIQNDVFTVSGNLGISEDEICSVIAVISPGSNCVCSASQINLMNQSISVQNVETCSGEAIDIGVAGTSGTDYVWDNPANLSCTDCPNPTFLAFNGDTTALVFNYTLTEDDGSCPKRTMIQVEVFPIPEILTNDQTVCEGETIQLNTTPASAVTWTGAGISDPSEPNPVINPVQSTTFYADFSAGSCSSKDSVTIEVIPGPMIDAGRDTAYCDAGTGIELSTFFDPNYTYFWEPNFLLSDFQIHNPVIISNVTSDFILTVRDQRTGCARVDTVSIEFGVTPNISTSPDMTICGGDMVQLMANGAETYQWSNGNTLDCDTCQTVIASPTTTTTYSITGTSASGNCPSTDSLTVSVEGQNRSTEEIYLVCDQDSIEVNGIVYTQNVDSTTVVPSIQDGCDSTHTFQITFSTSPVVSFDTAFFEIEIEDSTLISLPDGYDHYRWEPSAGLQCDTCQTTMASPSVTTVYTGFVLNEDGCEVEARSVRVVVHKKCSPDNITMPNIFSPNGDNRNEIFKPLDIGVEEIKSFRIFNRWGQKIYDGSGDNACWDGYYKGESQPTGVYVYIIEIGCGEEANDPLTGDITLLK